MGTRRRGFTLIELLVVIAIIGILASMVFPVFARARESARRAVCLSNVKNIALAFQMYLADNNDTLPPAEHRQEVWDYFQTGPGGGMEWEEVEPGECDIGTVFNPYLRWPVVLDEYIKNRDVWRCPSAKMESVAGFIYGFPDWFGHLQAYEGQWGYISPVGLCPANPYPAGWGGTITDSLSQEMMSWGDWGGDDFALKAFRNSIGWNARGNLGRKLVSVDDPVNFIVCGDMGPEQGRMTPGNTAYPDVCALDCAMCDAIWFDDWWTWDDCAEWVEPGCDPLFAYPEMITDPSLRKPFARHLGGVNLGFLDGHAASWNSERLLAKISEGKGEDMMGLSYAQWSGPASWCVLQETGTQWPTLY